MLYIVYMVFSIIYVLCATYPTYYNLCANIMYKQMITNEYEWMMLLP